MARFGHSLLARLEGKENTFCEGITNNAGDGKWFLFYDYDTGPAGGVSRYNARLAISAWAEALSSAWEIRETVGGLHLIEWTPRTLEDVYRLWEDLHVRFPSDYLWTVPLTLRDSPKWRYSDGSQLSPRPALVDSGAENYRPVRIRRCYYRNWE